MLLNNRNRGRGWAINGPLKVGEDVTLLSVYQGAGFTALRDYFREQQTTQTNADLAPNQAGDRSDLIRSARGVLYHSSGGQLDDWDFMRVAVGSQGKRGPCDAYMVRKIGEPEWGEARGLG